MDSESGEPSEERTNTSRRILSQILATSAEGLLLLNVGMTLCLIRLTPVFGQHDAEIYSFGNMVNMLQIIGYMLSGIMTEAVGPKTALMFLNILLPIGWILLYISSSSADLFIIFTTMKGFGTGLVATAAIVYTGEITEQSFRGMLISYLILFLPIGLAVEIALSKLCNYWTTVALISAFEAGVALIAVSLVPESPMWLLSKGRLKEAEKSLCWLRGWVAPFAVQEELGELIRYANESKRATENKPSKQIEANVEKTGVCSVFTDNPPSYERVVKGETTNPEQIFGAEDAKHKDDKQANIVLLEGEVMEREECTLLEHIRHIVRYHMFPQMDFKSLMEPQVLRSLLLVTTLFAFYYGTEFPLRGVGCSESFYEFDILVDRAWMKLITLTFVSVGIITCILLIRYTGKRILTLVSLVGCSAILFGMPLWIHLVLHSLHRSLPSWTPLALCIPFSFSFGLGIVPVSWISLAEVFPLRGRGLSVGLALAIAHVTGFVISKIFVKLEDMYGLGVVLCISGIITSLGVVYTYFKLPETENRPLEDIEKSFTAEEY